MTVAEMVANLLELDQSLELVVRVPGEIPDTLDEHEPHTLFVDRDGTYTAQAAAAFQGETTAPAVVLLAGEG